MYFFEFVLLTALLIVFFAALGWYLLIRTEGVYLGSRVVVWLYDRYAPRYDRTKKYDAYYEAWFLALPILKRLAGNPAPLILDVATGTGRLPVILLEQEEFQGHIVGLDLSREMLFHAALKLASFRERYNLIWQTAVELPFPDESFDAVTSLEALEFMPDQETVLAEMYRVLRPGGLFLITNRIGPDVRFLPGKVQPNERLAGRLEALGLVDIEFERWQVDYTLVWARKPGRPSQSGARPLVEYLRCPRCAAAGMIPLGVGGWVCEACELRVPIGDDGVIELFQVG